MRDDLAAPNIGQAPKIYDQGFFYRSYRDIELFIGRLLSKGPVAVSSLTVDGVAVVTEAPLDGQQYVRQNGAWIINPGTSATQNYEFNPTTTISPGPGTIRLNNATQTSATLLWLHYTNDNGVNIKTYITAKLLVGDTLYLQDRDEPGKWQLYTVSGAFTDNTTYVTIPVTWTAGGSPLTGQKIIVTRER